MDLQLYQIVILILAVFMIFQGGMRYLKHEGGQTLIKFSVRVIIWGGMAAIAVFPRLSNDLAEIIGIKGNVNAVVLIGFLLVFLLIFKLLSAIENLEQQITTVTREISLKSIGKDE